MFRKPYLIFILLLSLVACDKSTVTVDTPSRAPTGEPGDKCSDEGSAIQRIEYDGDDEYRISAEALGLSKVCGNTSVQFIAQPHSGQVHIDNVIPNSTTVDEIRTYGVVYTPTENSVAKGDSFKFKLGQQTQIVTLAFSRPTPTNVARPVVRSASFDQPPNGKTFFKGDAIELTVQFSAPVFVKDGSNRVEGEVGFTGNYPTIDLDLGDSCTAKSMTFQGASTDTCRGYQCGSGTPILKWKLQVGSQCTNLESVSVKAQDFFKAGNLKIVSGLGTSAEWDFDTDWRAPTSNKYIVLGLKEPAINNGSIKAQKLTLEGGAISAANDFNVTLGGYETVLGNHYDVKYSFSGADPSNDVASFAVDEDTGIVDVTSLREGPSIAVSVKIASSFLGPLSDAVKRYAVTVSDNGTDDSSINELCAPAPLTVGTSKKIPIQSYFEANSSGFKLLDDSNVHEPQEVTSLGISYSHKGTAAMSSVGVLTVNPYFSTQGHNDANILALTMKTGRYTKVCKISIHDRPALKDDIYILSLIPETGTFNAYTDGVLENDEDPNGLVDPRSFAVTHVGKTSGSVSAVPDVSDGELGSEDSYVSLQGRYGILKINKSGQFTYTMKSAFTAPTSGVLSDEVFTYKAIDKTTKLSSNSQVRFIIQSVEVAQLLSDKRIQVSSVEETLDHNTKRNAVDGMDLCDQSAVAPVCTFTVGETNTKKLNLDVSGHFKNGRGGSSTRSYHLSYPSTSKGVAEFSINSNGIINVKPHSSSSRLSAHEVVPVTVTTYDGNYFEAQKTYSMWINTPPVARKDTLLVDLDTNGGTRSIVGGHTGNVLVHQETLAGSAQAVPAKSRETINGYTTEDYNERKGEDIDNDRGDQLQVITVKSISAPAGRQRENRLIAGETTVEGRYGELEVHANGYVEYTKKSNVTLPAQKWQDEFEYTVEDHSGATDSARIVVTANHRPRVKLGEDEVLDDDSVTKEYYVSCDGGFTNNCKMTESKIGETYFANLEIDPRANGGHFYDDDNDPLIYKFKLSDTDNSRVASAFEPRSASNGNSGNCSRELKEGSSIEYSSVITCAGGAYRFDIKNNKILLTFDTSIGGEQYGTIHLKVVAADALSTSHEYVNYKIVVSEVPDAENDIFYLSLGSKDEDRITTEANELSYKKWSAILYRPYESGQAGPTTYLTENLVGDDFEKGLLYNDKVDNAPTSALCTEHTGIGGASPLRCKVISIDGESVPLDPTFSDLKDWDGGREDNSNAHKAGWSEAPSQMVRLTGQHGILYLNHLGTLLYELKTQTQISTSTSMEDSWPYEVSDNEGGKKEAKVTFKLERPTFNNSLTSRYRLNLNKSAADVLSLSPANTAGSLTCESDQLCKLSIAERVNLSAVLPESDQRNRHAYNIVSATGRGGTWNCSKQVQISSAEVGYECHKVGDDGNVGSTINNKMTFYIDNRSTPAELKIRAQSHTEDDKSLYTETFSSSAYFDIKIRAQYCETKEADAVPTGSGSTARDLFACDTAGYTSGTSETTYRITIGRPN